ncbi:hypothetical protein FDUTEX481_05979 [Tolypothrix sp. PCC 7601]|nr:hypothetical protein FDUTEX481_05979 [Tolypothrix sp. PCC 7601]
MRLITCISGKLLILILHLNHNLLKILNNFCNLLKVAFTLSPFPH